MALWRILLTFLYLLVLATSASAEAAWVLWLVTGDPNHPPAQAINSLRRAIWTPIAAFETEKACATAVTESRNQDREQSKDRAAGPRIFHCLPDTVDPRGPRGK
jgi:hypothetical protein